jgi:hypothetical protein
MLYPYPHDMPTSEMISLIVDFLRNKEVELKEAAHAAWHTAGYGLSKWDVHPLVVGSYDGGQNEQAAALLEKNFLGAVGDAAPVPDPKDIPWGVIIPIMLFIIERFLRRKDDK